MLEQMHFIEGPLDSNLDICPLTQRQKDVKLNGAKRLS